MAVSGRQRENAARLTAEQAAKDAADRKRRAAEAEAERRRRAAEAAAAAAAVGWERKAVESRRAAALERHEKDLHMR